jgi:PAS domain S-box-containing protein
MAGFFSRIFSGDKSAAGREDLYAAAFDQAPIGIALIGRDGQWLQLNDRLLRILGFSRDEILRTSIRELTHPEDRKIEAPYMRRLTTGEINSYLIEKRMLQRNKKYIDLRVTASRCRFGELEFVEFLFMPPGEERSAPAAALSSIESALEGVEDIAVIRLAPDGTITGWSRGAETIFGFRRDEVVRKSRTILYRDTDAFEQLPESELQKAMTQGTFDDQSWRINKEGFALWLHVTIVARRDERGNLVELVELARQTAQTKANPAQEAVRRRNEKLLEDAREAYQGLKEKSTRDLAAMQTRVEELEEQLSDRELRLRALQNDAGAHEEITRNLRVAAQDGRKEKDRVLAELKAMADALKNEIAKRKKLEQMVLETRRRHSESEEKWRAELDRVSAATPPQEQSQLAFLSHTGADVLTTDATAFLAALLELASREASGTLVARHGEAAKSFFIDNGRLTACLASNSGRLPLGESLVASGRVTADQRDRALEIQQETGIALGRILLIMGAVTEDELLELMRDRSRIEAAEVFDWDEVEHFFIEGEAAPQNIVPLQIPLGDFVAGVARHVTAADGQGEPELEPEEQVIEAEEPRLEVVATDEPSAEPAPVSEPVEEEPVPVVAASSSAPQFIGSGTKKSKKYHLPTCASVKKLAESKRVPLASTEQAEAEGYVACGQCVAKKARGGKRPARKSA